MIRPADSFEASPLPAAATPRALVVARARRPDNEQPRPTQDGRDTALGPHDALTAAGVKIEAKRVVKALDAAPA